MRISTSSFMKKPNIDNTVETAQGQGTYAAAQGVNTIAQTTAKLAERNQRLEAAADLAELKTGMAAWIAERENTGDIDDLPNRAEKEMTARLTAAKKTGAFYHQAVQEGFAQTKADLSGFAENAVVNATLAKNRENAERIIANTTQFTRAEPDNMDANIQAARTEIENSFLSPAEKAKLIEKLGVDVSLAVIDDELQSSPDTLESSIRNGKYKNYMSLERQEQFLRAAVEQKSKFQKTDVYSSLYAGFKDKDGVFDYQSAVLFLRNPDNQKKMGLTAESANAVGDMLYSQFTQESAMRETARSNSAVAETDVAVAEFYKGNAATAIQSIQDSKTIKGDEKLRLIASLKSGKFGAESDFIQSAETAKRIARREINTDEELLSMVAEGKLTKQGYDTARDFLKKRDDKGFAHVQRALDQLKEAYGKSSSLGGRMTPAETEAFSYMTTEIMDLWNDLVTRKATLAEIREVFSPTNIDKLGRAYSPDMKNNIQSMTERFNDSDTIENKQFIDDLRIRAKNKAVVPAKPNENIDDYLKRTEAEK